MSRTVGEGVQVLDLTLCYGYKWVCFFRTQDDHAPLWEYVTIKEKIGEGVEIGFGIVIFVK